ncbi:hypothetical protein SK803_34495 [Lentzea sp. BCCO 10_0856]|uniref:Uncharacterized protein n=1 Tax=Lentzea miocenica TaxID=3095431 RepID=A0ABU4TAY7_9PSEU|nr:hypothetical protein [Lentzea sp. BCCO 10_0856]MDX8035347.1 hypothetical protein [Lentzea sp. BCCO 10_0856]
MKLTHGGRLAMLAVGTLLLASITAPGATALPTESDSTAKCELGTFGTDPVFGVVKSCYLVS